MNLSLKAYPSVGDVPELDITVAVTDDLVALIRKARDAVSSHSKFESMLIHAASRVTVSEDGRVFRPDLIYIEVADYAWWVQIRDNGRVYHSDNVRIECKKS